MFYETHCYVFKVLVFNKGLCEREREHCLVTALLQCAAVSRTATSLQPPPPLPLSLAALAAHSSIPSYVPTVPQKMASHSAHTEERGGGEGERH